MFSRFQQFQEWIPSIPNAGPSTITYAVLFALMFKVPWKLGLKDWEWFKTKVSFNKYVFWGHGILTFGILWICEPRNLGPLLGGTTGVALDSSLARWIQQVLISLLAIVLWDFGCANYSGVVMIFLVNCHHIGAFLPVLLGPGWNIDTFLDSNDVEASRANLELQTSLDTRLFGWLWMIHSFGFLLEVILPLVGVKLEENSRSYSVDAIKHVYSMVSVYFFHQYINYNPERFFTYQTSSLMIMLTGRYIINNNWKTLGFLRRIEFPGFWVVLLDRVLGFNDVLCYRSLAIVVGMYGTYTVYAVFLRNDVPMPERYVGPDANPALKKFLEDETPVVIGNGRTATTPTTEAALEKFRSVHGLFNSWWARQKINEKQTTWAEAYPIHNRVMVGRPGEPADVRVLTKLLDEGTVKNNLDTTLKEHYDLTPLQFAAFNKYAYECTLLLLKRGADPYKENAQGGCAVQSGLKDSMSLSLIRPGSLGFSEGFWERFNAICLEQSPPRVLTRRQKFFKIL